MREIMLKEPVELKLPAQQNMMLVLRLTTAGVIARAGLTVDRMDDVKMAVEEACSCLVNAKNPPERLCLTFEGDEQGLVISVCGDSSCVKMEEDERSVVGCILEALADSVEICMDGEYIAAIRMRVALNQ